LALAYHPKKTSTKYIEGAVAGLVGGLVVAVIMMAADALTRTGSPWWYTPSLIGSLVTGTPQGNVASLNGSFFIGVLLHFAIFAIIGLGFVSYKPLFRRFKIPVWAGGALYGALIWLSVFFIALNTLKPAASSMLNHVLLFVACIAGGAALGWWISRPQLEPRPGSPSLAQ
jgi:hypothetical protein